MKLSIIIPAYNEEETIEELLRKVFNVQIEGYEKEVIVVDDKSEDRTIEILKNLENEFDFILLKHFQNKGKGGCIKTALKKVTGDFVIIQDADLEYEPNDYPLLLNSIDKSHQIVYGSRNLGRAERGYFLFFLAGRMLTFLSNLLYGAKITDINTCYKLFRTDIIKNIALKGNGFEFCEEVTVKALRRGYKIKEVPIHYYPRSFSKGKKIRFKDGLIAIRTILKYRFRK